MKKGFFTVLCYLFFVSNGFAQEQPRGKVSGYVQSQYQWGEQDASLKVGTPNENPEESFERLGIRRGRIKFTYEESIASGVFQLDMTEKGVGIKDAYLNVRDPWGGTTAFTTGVFDRPFGNEISYSSSRRESPERSTIFQTLFPDERDLGAMIALQAAKTSPWNFLKLEAGLFAGNGIKQETDNRKDFIGHLSANKSEKNIGVAGGISYYNGSVYQGTANVYEMSGNGFVLKDSPGNMGRFARREYIGIDAQFSMNNVWGATQLRAEYLFGRQPGASSGSKSPNSSVLPASDTYIRNFSGGYAILVQNLGKLPFAAVLKYDWYDPNAQVSGNDIGLNRTAKGDVAQSTFGFGMLWNLNASLRLQAYYEINKNEKTENLAGYGSDRGDNVFTLRMQYKF
jgi:Phosphate-selective porin